MPAYVIVNVGNTTSAEYDGYKATAQKTVAQYGGRYLARGGKMKVVEGEWKPSRIVVLAFDSFDQALAWWNSPEYAPAKALRQRLIKTDMIIVDGYDDAHHAQ